MKRIITISIILVVLFAGCSQDTQMIEAQKWQRIANQMLELGEFMPKRWDCDTRTILLVDSMKERGLICGKDFVVVWGNIGEERHMRLEMYKRYEIDPASPGMRMTNVWKGEYFKK